jgi:hypothetical protein
MATSFTINKIDYTNTPSGSQVWSFYYKLFSAPDSAYVLISSSASVAIDGNLAVPLTVTGLTPGTLYYIKAVGCGSPPDVFIQQVST